MMYSGSAQHGILVGDGAAQNVSLGFVPDLVIVTNVTDGDVVNIGHPNSQYLGFDGGSTEINPRDFIVGATSGAEAVVKRVFVTSGSWAGGDAAGYIEVSPVDVTGTWQNNEEIDVYLPDQGGLKQADNAATVDGTLVTLGVDIDTEVAADTGITAYAGTTTASAGFTIAAGISESGKLLRWDAWHYGGQ